MCQPTQVLALVGADRVDVGTAFQLRGGENEPASVGRSGKVGAEIQRQRKLGKVGTIEYDKLDPVADTGTELPTEVAGISSAIEASVSSECALLSNGTVTCWGVDPLNTGSDYDSTHKITGLENAVHISGSCALLSSGGVDCWGGSLLGQLGNGTVSFEGSEDTAVSATGITNASAISGNAYDACAVLADGTVRCWRERGRPARERAGGLQPGAGRRLLVFRLVALPRTRTVDPLLTPPGRCYMRSASRRSLSPTRSSPSSSP